MEICSGDWNQHSASKGSTKASLLVWFLHQMLTVHSIFADQPIQWAYDVYTGRHFNDLVTHSVWDDDVMFNSALLVLYAPACAQTARDHKTMLRPWGPPDHHLIIAFHDYVTYPRHIWYDFDDVDNLELRYMTEHDGCLKVSLGRAYMLRHSNVNFGGLVKY